MDETTGVDETAGVDDESTGVRGIDAANAIPIVETVDKEEDFEHQEVLPTAEEMFQDTEERLTSDSELFNRETLNVIAEVATGHFLKSLLTHHGAAGWIEVTNQMMTNMHRPTRSVWTPPLLWNEDSYT